MGAKTLAQELEVEEEKAVELMATFKNSYPKIQTFIEETLTRCRSVH